MEWCFIAVKRDDGNLILNTQSKTYPSILSCMQHAMNHKGSGFYSEAMIGPLCVEQLSFALCILD